MPGNTDLLKLLSIINYWQRNFRFWLIETPEWLRLISDEQKAMQTLSEILPRIREKVVWQNEQLKGRRNDRIDRIDRLMKCLSDCRNRRGMDDFWELSNTKSMTWKDLQIALSEDIVFCLRKTNPTAKIGTSDKGPISRLIAAIMPTVTGDLLRPSTVGRARKGRPQAPSK